MARTLTFCTSSHVAGNAPEIFLKYVAHLDEVLETFCEQHWPCEYRHHKPPHVRCVNVRTGHVKGHQSKDGKVMASGGYEDNGFSFDEYRSEFRNNVYLVLDEMLGELGRLQVQDSDLSEQRGAAKIHKEIVLKNFFQRMDPPERRDSGTGCLTSHSTCFACLLEPGEHPLPCGHLSCTPCVMSYGDWNGIASEVKIDECPIEGALARFPKGHMIRIKPDLAGIRVMALDGYVYHPALLFLAELLSY